MSGLAPFEQFGAAYWEERYRGGEGAGRHDPSPSLVAETGGLLPGRALDAGCGVDADALWLAAHGWQVTAVDVSPTAVQAGRRVAEAAGAAFAARIEWTDGDLTRWEPGQGTFDLVTSHYVHVPGPPEELFRRLASWVAPGGTLLVVGHDHGHAHPAGAQVRTGADRPSASCRRTSGASSPPSPAPTRAGDPAAASPSRSRTSSSGPSGGPPRNPDLAARRLPGLDGKDSRNIAFSDCRGLR